ncbi:hypothetical protein TBLA_0H02800 [Henningerozyma blattae CBS 6284]|uniref:Actin-like protein ARP9 n=1 Tax=Henningerozyma blattae (strain ATCC 34711 / CBS 6284 / DSM 70876 / NBRC 10599 / NRRL Y-10934 / UCD 77-7) TaxID=1071380 RepID=I2H862_HENB6|nr:hypothetical protein TBLA_0H02800 [Tetrapisispora blattae CBS 6284]CCH62564.1 hypothetical protein TBLA_0H02800 [Tetrapisispora blattae CBS 6284]
MVHHRLDNILIIYPRSQTTLVQFGLHNDTFYVPELEIPTIIYKSTNDKGESIYYPTEGPNRLPICPIENGMIINLEAFQEFLKYIYISLLKQKHDENADSFEYSFTNIPLLLLNNHKWSQFQMESITNFVFEKLKLNGLMLLPISLGASYSMVSLQNCCIIDIGLNHTDIVPIVDYTTINHLSNTLNYGGSYINTILQKLLPELNDQQIEDLKKSPIFEVLTEDEKNDSAFDFNNPITTSTKNKDDDDADFDVASIINSGKDTREILAEREKKNQKKSLPNSQLEFNTFKDNNGNQIKIGKQRFQGCDELIQKISTRVGHTINQLEDLSKQRAIWENIVIVGNTSLITGFKEALLNQLVIDHLVVEPADEKRQREKENFEKILASQNESNTSTSSTITNKKNNTKAYGAPFLPSLEYVHGPSVIKLAKYPEYFPEWKKHGYGDIVFLGGQIVAKQIFTHSKDTFYTTKHKYERHGPSAIWNVEF